MTSGRCLVAIRIGKPPSQPGLPFGAAGGTRNPLPPTRLAVRSAALDQQRHMVTSYLMLGGFKNAQVL